MSESARVIRFPTECRQAPALVDLRGLQAEFGFSERFWRYRLAEKMPHHKWGNRMRFNVAEVRVWLDEHYEEASGGN